VRSLRIAGLTSAIASSLLLTYAWPKGPGDAQSQRPKPAESSATTNERQNSTALKAPSREVQRVSLQKMKSKKPDRRVAAVRALADYPSGDTARFLARHGLTSDYTDVRHATYDTLLKLNQVEPVANYLLETVAKEVKRPAPPDAVGAMLAIAMASPDAEIERRAMELFDKFARRTPDGLGLLMALVDELGAQADKTSVATLVKVSKRAVFAECFALRRGVVQALIRISLPESLEALVSLLATATGEVRGDIVRHLTFVSGQKYGLDPPAWAAWWKAQQGELPRGGGQTVSMAEALPLKSSYYGMPIYAARLVFVLDTSASMAGGSILAAKWELSQAIASLPEGAYFNVLAFDIGVWPWSAQLVQASNENKTDAIAWVGLRGLGPQTASYNALEAAFAFDTESIFFLTDGQPAGGKIDNPAQIVAVLTALNRTRRLTINSIGVGVGPPGPLNPFDQFLQGLASLNYGEYRRVAQ
jgi:hypothetical protein